MTHEKMLVVLCVKHQQYVILLTYTNADESITTLDTKLPIFVQLKKKLSIQILDRHSPVKKVEICYSWLGQNKKPQLNKNQVSYTYMWVRETIFFPFKSVCTSMYKRECTGPMSQTIIMTKVQIISEVNCGVLNFPKNQQNYLKNFCPSL